MAGRRVRKSRLGGAQGLGSCIDGGLDGIATGGGTRLELAGQLCRPVEERAGRLLRKPGSLLAEEVRLGLRRLGNRRSGGSGRGFGEPGDVGHGDPRRRGRSGLDSGSWRRGFGQGGGDRSDFRRCRWRRSPCGSGGDRRSGLDRGGSRLSRGSLTSESDDATGALEEVRQERGQPAGFLRGGRYGPRHRLGSGPSRRSAAWCRELGDRDGGLDRRLARRFGGRDDRRRRHGCHRGSGRGLRGWGQFAGYFGRRDETCRTGGRTDRRERRFGRGGRLGRDNLRGCR